MGPSAGTVPSGAPVQQRAPILPLSITSLIDIGRLQRELEALEMFLAQAAARQPGQALTMPRTTRSMEDLCRENGWNLLDASHRKIASDYLKDLREKAPHIHVSFTADPSSVFLQKVVGWFRTQIHPQAILQVGLQPTIAAGCVVRTTNKYFDLSIRQHFDERRSLLNDMIKQTRDTGEATIAAPATEAPRV